MPRKIYSIAFLAVIMLNACKDPKDSEKINDLQSENAELKIKIVSLNAQIKDLKVTPENIIADANKFMNNKKYADALNDFNIFLEKYPTHKDKDYVSKSIEKLNILIKEEDEIKQYSFTAFDFYSAFKNSRVAFDNKYDDKIVQIEGEIKRINSDGDCYSIEIKGEEDASIECIECFNCKDGLSVKEWIDQISKVSVGENVTVRGHYSKHLSDDLGYKIQLYKCSIVE